jgi:arabinofuranosyltransferase
MTTAPVPARTRLARPFAALLLLVFAVVLIRTAWISDDAQISLRTVMNVTHGYGLTFNSGERVQTFTHPLWLLALTGAYLVLPNIYYATFALSIAVSLLVFWRMIRSAATNWQGWLAAAVLLSSRAFVDYSTSGLENPLGSLLMMGFAAVLMHERLNRAAWLTFLWGFASLLYLTRPDLVLLVAPALVLATWRSRRLRTSLAAVALGLLPAVVWTAFSVVYYGFPFPNTAYAKLGMGISQAQLTKQGVLYLVDVADRDPATAVVLLAGLVWGFGAGRGPNRPLVLGLGLYLWYVARIGGDFMAGRFVMVPLVVAALVLTRTVEASWRTWAATVAAVVVLGIASPKTPLLADSRFTDPGVKHNGVVDERVFYLKNHSLLYANMNSFAEPDWFMPRPPGPPRVMNTCGLMGESGLAWGPHVHLLDECALAEPLLARLPAVFKEEWRPGHFRRWVPDGYRETLETGVNQIRNLPLREYYDHLADITRADRVWSKERFLTIWRMNTGHYDRLIDRESLRFSGYVKSLDEVSDVKPDETAADAPGVFELRDPLAVRVPDHPGRRYVDVSLTSAGQYVVVFIKGDAALGRVVLGPIPQYRRKPGLVSYTLDIPSRPRTEGFDILLVAPAGGDRPYVAGHVLVDGNERTDQQLLKKVQERDARR